MPNIPIKNKISTRMYTFSKNIMKLHVKASASNTSKVIYVHVH